MVNPLDAQELPVFSRDLRTNMPLYWNNHIKVKLGGFSDPPKNFTDYSFKVNDDFLNSYLHVIEEMRHRDKSNDFVKRFIHYQNKHFVKSGALSKDHIFKWMNEYPGEPMIRGGGGGGRRGYFVNFGKVIGATLETNDGSTASNGSMGIGTILHLNKLPAGTIGDYYDGISQKMSGTTGSVKHAVYTDSTPGARLALLGSTAKYTSYTLQTVTEFQLSATANWAASVDDQSDSPEYYYKIQSSGDMKQKTIVYADGPPDPAGAGYSDQIPVFQMKIGHS